MPQLKRGFAPRSNGYDLADFITSTFPLPTRVTRGSNEHVPAIPMAIVGHIGEFDLQIVFYGHELNRNDELASTRQLFCIARGHRRTVGAITICVRTRPQHSW